MLLRFGLTSDLHFASHSANDSRKMKTNNRDWRLIWCRCNGRRPAYHPQTRQKNHGKQTANHLKTARRGVDPRLNLEVRQKKLAVL